MNYRLKCYPEIPKQRYFFDQQWGESLWFFGVSDTIDPFSSARMKSDSPFTLGRLKPSFEEWARDCLTGKWFVADSFRVAFHEPGDLTLTYLTFL